MPPFVAELNVWLAVGTLALQAAIVLVILLLSAKNSSFSQAVLGLLKQWALPVGFLGALVASALTLVYSDVFGFIPCALCWLQRIFLYPQVVLLGMAWYKKDSGVWKYIIALSIVGVIIALYHHYLQMGGSELIPCPASGESDCGQRILYEFNYVTYPLMAATLFAWHIVLGFIARKNN